MKRPLVGWEMVPVLIAVAMFAWSGTILKAHPLPAIYHDCLRHGQFMLPVSETERFCIDNRGIIHFPGSAPRNPEATIHPKAK